LFIPHIPVPQNPDPQAPLPHEAGAAAAAFGLAARAENVEYSVVKCFSPHAGHAIASASAARRTSFSNLVPQSSHEYSKIGIYSSVTPAQPESK
jgi:hypothetical protein